MLTETTPETEVQQGMTEDAAASELLKRWGAPREEEDAAEAKAEQTDEVDAQAEDDAEEMERFETEILAGLGMPDPYASTTNHTAGKIAN